jgi:phosphatidylglycerophosphatase A
MRDFGFGLRRRVAAFDSRQQWRTAFKEATFSQKFILGLATWFGFGLVPGAPGTAGTLAALPLVFLTSQLRSWQALILVGAFLLFAVWIAHQAQKLLALKDPGVIVIDEAVGLWVTLFGVPLSFLNVFLGFLLFRIFDIMKPYPTKKIESLKGGFGIVLDDVLAGIYANLILRLIIFVIN